MKYAKITSKNKIIKTHFFLSIAHSKKTDRLAPKNSIKIRSEKYSTSPWPHFSKDYLRVIYNYRACRFRYSFYWKIISHKKTFRSPRNLFYISMLSLSFTHASRFLTIRQSTIQKSTCFVYLFTLEDLNEENIIENFIFKKTCSPFLQIILLLIINISRQLYTFVDSLYYLSIWGRKQPIIIIKM